MAGTGTDGTITTIIITATSDRDRAVTLTFYARTTRRLLTMTSIRILGAAVVLAALSAGGITPATAAPIGQSLAATAPPSGLTEPVYWRGRGWGWGWGGPFIAGAVIGGALAAPYYYYGPGPYYRAYGPPPGYAAAPPDDAEAYCMQRFRSYDPNTGTYRGSDGRRHACP
jgi:hypothetical protein